MITYQLELLRDKRQTQSTSEQWLDMYRQYLQGEINKINTQQWSNMYRQYRWERNKRWEQWKRDNLRRDKEFREIVQRAKLNMKRVEVSIFSYSLYFCAFVLCYYFIFLFVLFYITSFNVSLICYFIICHTN